MTASNKKAEKDVRPSYQPRKGETEGHFLARSALDPSLTGAATISTFSPSFLDPIALADCLIEQSKVVNDGNLERAEAMLITQAHTLDSLFASLARRSATSLGENAQTAERYMRLALKAQSQCRATLQTLSELKNPVPIAFVHQANITSGPQQVNNGQSSLSSTRTREKKTKSTKRTIGNQTL